MAEFAESFDSWRVVEEAAQDHRRLITTLTEDDIPADGKWLEATHRSTARR